MLLQKCLLVHYTLVFVCGCAQKDDAVATLTAQVTQLTKDNLSKDTQVTELRRELDDTRTQMIALRRNSRAMEMNMESLKHRLQTHERSVHFNDSATTVSVVDLKTLPSTLPSINGKKKLSSAKGSRKARRPSTVH